MLDVTTWGRLPAFPVLAAGIGGLSGLIAMVTVTIPRGWDSVVNSYLWYGIAFCLGAVAGLVAGIPVAFVLRWTAKRISTRIAFAAMCFLLGVLSAFCAVIAMMFWRTESWEFDPVRDAPVFAYVLAWSIVPGLLTAAASFLMAERPDPADPADPVMQRRDESEAEARRTRHEEARRARHE